MLTLLNTPFIHLNDNRLDGSIPNSIGNLHLLQDLYILVHHMIFISHSIRNLQDNLLTGHIPESFGRLTSLIRLYVMLNVE